MADRLSPWSAQGATWVDGKTGRLSAEAARWLQRFFEMTGGSQLDSSTNVVQIIEQFNTDTSAIEALANEALSKADEQMVRARPAFSMPADQGNEVLMQRVFA